MQMSALLTYSTDAPKSLSVCDTLSNCKTVCFSPGKIIWTDLQLSLMIICNTIWSILIHLIRDILSGDSLA